MGAMTASERSRPRKQEILELARALFGERGYHETSLQDITDRLGITRPAFYYYFASKEDILWTLIEALGNDLLAQARPLADSDLDPAAKLARIVEQHVTLVLSNAATFKVYFSERDTIQGERNRLLKEGEHAYARLVADVVAAGQAAGVFRTADPMVLALLVLGLTNSVLRWYKPAGRLDVAALAAETSRMALQGLTPVGDPHSGSLP